MPELFSPGIFTITLSTGAAAQDILPGFLIVPAADAWMTTLPAGIFIPATARDAHPVAMPAAVAIF